MKISILFHLVLASASSLLPEREDKREANHLERRNIATKPGFQLTWSDDFNGPAGAFSKSSQQWIIDTGTMYPGGPVQWGNSEVETYTSSVSNLAITPSGTLLITPILKNGNWTSGRIETVRQDFAAAPGKKMLVESRFKIGNAPAAVQQGIWPAFWSLGTAFRANITNWPAVGEWDIFESINGLASMRTTVHCGTAPGGPCDEYDGINNNGSTAYTRGEFHTVGFLVDRSTGNWKTESVTWLLDGVAAFSVKGATIGVESVWDALAHAPHFILFDVAVGGSLPDAIAGVETPNNSTIGGLSVGMEVDYVAVYNS